MPHPLFRQVLDSLPCGCCGGQRHGPMFPKGRCHMSSNETYLSYHDGVTTISCGECSLLIIEVLTDEPEFDLPDEPVETYYDDGKLHLKDLGTITVSSDPRLN